MIKGLLIKDLCVLKQQYKLYIILTGFWIILSLKAGNAIIFAGLIPIFSVLLPVTTIAYDEQAKWEKYALSMPLTRISIVISKYVIGLLATLAVTVIALVLNVFFKKNVFEFIKLSVIFILLGLFFMSVMFPVIFKLGSEKGRMVMMIIMLFPAIATIFFSKENIIFLSDKSVNLLLCITGIAIIIFFLLSLLLSVKIYNRKEF